MDYALGLATLETALADADQNTQRDIALYKAQLSENLHEEARYGDTEQLRANRYQIVDKLNPLAIRLTGVSFTDLCLGLGIRPLPGNGKPESTIQWPSQAKPLTHSSEAEPNTAWVTLTFQGPAENRSIAWRSTILGERITPFSMPYNDSVLPTVIKALDAVQWPDHPHDGPTFTDDEQVLLASFGLWSNGQVPSQSYKTVGQALYNALGVEGQAALMAARNDGIAYRHPTNYVLRFPADAVQVAALPWEAIADQGQPVLLTRGHNIDSCQRYLQSVRALPPPLEHDQQIRILALSPQYQIPDDVRAQERTARLGVWEQLRDSGRVLFEEITPVTTHAISDYLRRSDRQPDIVHYFGHGIYRNGQGYLVFDDGDGGRELVGAERLTAMFGETRLMVIYACQSAMVTQEGGLLSGVAPALSMVSGAIVAMQLTTRISAATRFAEVFYEELLGRNCSLQAAVATGRQTLFFEEQDGVSWFVPTLYIRSNEAKSIYLV